MKTKVISAILTLIVLVATWFISQSIYTSKTITEHIIAIFEALSMEIFIGVFIYFVYSFIYDIVKKFKQR